mmetsp:Transcript_27323/g.77120  ORF Transcript_27323/g.77120 Transcript_27323/m.77120 type:complete len:208 (-) Transcript_27323:4087-4710(-)
MCNTLMPASEVAPVLLSPAAGSIDLPEDSLTASDGCPVICNALMLSLEEPPMLLSRAAPSANLREDGLTASDDCPIICRARMLSLVAAALPVGFMLPEKPSRALREGGQLPTAAEVVSSRRLSTISPKTGREEPGPQHRQASSTMRTGTEEGKRGRIPLVLTPWMTCCMVCPSKARAPENISYRRIPKAYTSAALDSLPVSRISGAM